MQHTYHIICKLAKPNEDLSHYSEVILNGMRHFNTKSISSKNPKHISDLSIKNSSVYITLLSTTEIEPNHISRALRVFTLYVIEHAPELLFNKRIFNIRATPSFFTNTGSELTDEEMLKELIHIVLHQEDRDTINKIKTLLLERNTSYE